MTCSRAPTVSRSETPLRCGAADRPVRATSSPRTEAGADRGSGSPRRAEAEDEARPSEAGDEPRPRRRPRGERRGVRAAVGAEARSPAASGARGAAEPEVARRAEPTRASRPTPSTRRTRGRATPRATPRTPPTRLSSPVEPRPARGRHHRRHRRGEERGAAPRSRATVLRRSRATRSSTSLLRRIRTCQRERCGERFGDERPARRFATHRLRRPRRARLARGAPASARRRQHRGLARRPRARCRTRRRWP